MQLVADGDCRGEVALIMLVADPATCSQASPQPTSRYSSCRLFAVRNLTARCSDFLFSGTRSQYGVTPSTPLWPSLTRCAMDDWVHILLPYGLSGHYHFFCTGGKGMILPCAPPRFRIATLREVSTLNSSHPYSLPPASTSIARYERRALREKVKSARKQNMVAFGRNVKKINMGPATGKEKRGRPRKKTQPPAPATTKGKIARHPKSVGSGTRVGAAQHIPITLDNDDDEEDLEVGARNHRGYDLSTYTLARVLTLPAMPASLSTLHFWILTWATLHTNPALPPQPRTREVYILR
jgi:hypothetical protein